MKLIPLTQGKFAMVDDVDYEWISKFNWHYCKGKKDNSAYALTTISRKTISMHRLIMGCKFGDGTLVDHEDRNGLNCQRYNMRKCNKSQNGANTISKKNSTSTYLGVSLLIIKDKYGEYHYWRARVKKNYKELHVGIFKDELSAAKAYNEAAIKHHGEFASVNKIV